jgi:hypothetical protein
MRSWYASARTMRSWYAYARTMRSWCERPMPCAADASARASCSWCERPCQLGSWRLVASCPAGAGVLQDFCSSLQGVNLGSWSSQIVSRLQRFEPSTWLQLIAIGVIYILPNRRVCGATLPPITRLHGDANFRIVSSASTAIVSDDLTLDLFMDSAGSSRSRLPILNYSSSNLLINLSRLCNSSIKHSRPSLSRLCNLLINRKTNRNILRLDNLLINHDRPHCSINILSQLSQRWLLIHHRIVYNLLIYRRVWSKLTSVLSAIFILHQL